MNFRRQPTGAVDGSVDNISVDLPAGFVGDPTSVPVCTAEQFESKPLECPAQSQVGILHLRIVGAFGAANMGATDETVYPVYNLEPRNGNVAELGFGYASGERVVTVRIVAKARTNGDFGVTTFVGQIPAALPVINQQITLWGVPWAATHDLWRAPQGFPPGSGVCNIHPGSAMVTFYIPHTGLPASCQQHYDPSWGEIRPFISNLTECTGSGLETLLATDSFQHQGAYTAERDPDLSDPDWKTYLSPAPAITGCEKPPFDPQASFTPTASAAGGASGLTADITVPQNDDPPAGVANDPSDSSGAPAHWRSDAGAATSHLDKSVVALPAGLSVNPSSATGLQGCTDGQMGVRAVGNPYLFDNSEPACPDGSKIGTVEATTPLLDGSPNLQGDVFLGAPKSTDPASGDMFRMFLVLGNPDRGLLAKVYGSAVADPQTGQLTATFDKNPRVPVENIRVDIKGGQRGVLALPQTCGEKTTSSVFTPWTAAHGGGGVAKTVDSAFTVNDNCSAGFAPMLAAGMDARAARASGTFSFRFSRSDGEPWIQGLTATLPQGLLASVKDVLLCSNAAADAGACPAGSKIGVVDAKAGSGDPFVLEQKGEVFLTEGYKGGPYGLAVKIRPIAGPFRDSMELSPIVVRQKIDVDRTSAQVTAVSDPFPLIHHGVPLRVREVTVLVDRDRFMLNPSDCAAKRVGAAILSDQGAAASPANGFQASGCAGLAFKPKLKLALTGRKQIRTGKHPGIKATVTQQGVPEAGIEKAVVRLPKSLALDVNNAQALCEYVDGTKPDLENHCPKGSIVGRAQAVSPLLNDPLAGNAYFVKNVRIDPKTGNQIRTLPMIVVALRGEIAINLRGESDTTNAGRLVNTFNEVPDAPVSQFNLDIKGGKAGIIAVTRTRRSLINLCATGRQVAEADMDGHNGRRHDTNINMRKPCPTGKAKRTKKTAKQRRAAANRKTAKR
jgi:hypothetical protein